MKKYEIDMCNGPIMSKLIMFTLPLILSSILQLLFNAADIIVVGQFAGSNALAAVGSTGALTNFIINIFMGLSIGANVLVAKYRGANKDKDVKETVHTAIAISLLAGVFLAIVGVIVAKPALALMSTPDNVIDLAADYMRIYFLGMPVIMLYNFGAAILRAVGDTKRPLYFLSIAGVVNVLLNLFFVIVCNMAVVGVALATVLSQTISALLVFRCLVTTKENYGIKIKEIKIIFKQLKKMMIIGIPAGIQGCFFSISNMLIQSSINSFGSIVMAGNSAATNIEGFVYASMNAVHQGAISFTSQNYGASDWKRIKKVLAYSLILVVVVGGVLGFIANVNAKTLISIYNNDNEVIKYGVLRLGIIMSTYFLCGMMDVMVGSLRGLGCSVGPMFTSLMGCCVFRVVWVYTVFRSLHTLECLYYSYPITWILTFLAHTVVFIYVFRKRKKSMVL